MTVLVTDTGFAPDDWIDGYIPLVALSDTPDELYSLGIDLTRPELDQRDLDRIKRVLPRTGLIRIFVRSFGDTSALTLARSLRDAGYEGRLRAHGAMLARFYTFARRAGFDEVELTPVQARMQPREHWRNELDWTPVYRVPRPRGSAKYSGTS